MGGGARGRGGERGNAREGAVLTLRRWVWSASRGAGGIAGKTAGGVAAEARWGDGVLAVGSLPARFRRRGGREGCGEASYRRRSTRDGSRRRWCAATSGGKKWSSGERKELVEGKQRRGMECGAGGERVGRLHVHGDTASAGGGAGMGAWHGASGHGGHCAGKKEKKFATPPPSHFL